MWFENLWATRGMPPHCFISHAYDDAAVGAIDTLRKQLPRHVSPFIFPPIKVTPDQRVSDDLVSAIRSQKALIHLAGPSSSKSVWVNFERDYALRAGMPVFEFDFVTGKFRRDRSKPRQLRIFPEYSRVDRDRIDEMKTFLRDRHFDILDLEDNIAPGQHWAESVRSNLLSVLNGGGCVVAFLSKSYLNSPRDRRELQIASEQAPERVLPVLIDPIHFRELPPGLRNRRVVRVHRFKPLGSAPHWNRVDDLMVRIYAMVHDAEGAGA